MQGVRWHVLHWTFCVAIYWCNYIFCGQERGPASVRKMRKGKLSVHKQAPIARRTQRVLGKLPPALSDSRVVTHRTTIGRRRTPPKSCHPFFTPSACSRFWAKTDLRSIGVNEKITWVRHIIVTQNRNNRSNYFVLSMLFVYFKTGW